MLMAQDTGFAKVLLEELGLEVPMHIARPLQLGDRFQVEVTSINLAEGSFRFVDVSAAIESARVGSGVPPSSPTSILGLRHICFRRYDPS
jgi:hypothetical protein